MQKRDSESEKQWAKGRGGETYITKKQRYTNKEEEKQFVEIFVVL